MLPSVLTSISINHLHCLHGVRSFDAAALEKALVRRVLPDIRGLTLLSRIDASLLAKLNGRNLGVIARSFLAMVRRRNRRQVLSVFRHRFLANGYRLA